MAKVKALIDRNDSELGLSEYIQKYQELCGDQVTVEYITARYNWFKQNTPENHQKMIDAYKLTKASQDQVNAQLVRAIEIQQVVKEVSNG